MSIVQFIQSLSVRTKIVISAAVVAAFAFILTTPLIAWFEDILSVPDAPINVTLEKVPEGVEIRWDRPQSIDIRSYQLLVGGTQRVFTEPQSELLLELTEFPIYISLQSVDIFGSSSDSVGGTVDDEFVLQRFRTGEEGGRTLAPETIVVSTVFIGVIISALTQFILLFPLRSTKRIILGLYPLFVLIPFLLLSFSFLASEENTLGQFIVSIAASLLTFVLSYFVFLTTNILHTSLLRQIPLEQAARAAQFIFSLIAVYFVLILFFGVQFNFFEKLLLILPFVFYLSFSTIAMLAEERVRTALVKALSISLTILYAIFVLSIWPINYIYAILTIAVFFYIMLSMSLELRKQVNNYVWIEYAVLGSIVIFLLLINSSWGINGTLI